MSLVAGKCTQCGASIEFDSSKKIGICPSCGTKYLTKDITINNISNYSYAESINGQNINRIAVLEKMLIKYYSQEFSDIDNLKEYSYKVLELDNNNALASFVAFKNIDNDDYIINFINEEMYAINHKLLITMLTRIKSEKLFNLKIEMLLSSYSKEQFDLFRDFLVECGHNVIGANYEKILKLICESKFTNEQKNELIDIVYNKAPKSGVLRVLKQIEKEDIGYVMDDKYKSKIQKFVELNARLEERRRQERERLNKQKEEIVPVKNSKGIKRLFKLFKRK